MKHRSFAGSLVSPLGGLQWAGALAFDLVLAAAVWWTIEWRWGIYYEIHTYPGRCWSLAGLYRDCESRAATERVAVLAMAATFIALVLAQRILAGRRSRRESARHGLSVG